MTCEKNLTFSALPYSASFGEQREISPLFASQLLNKRGQIPFPSRLAHWILFTPHIVHQSGIWNSNRRAEERNAHISLKGCPFKCTLQFSTNRDAISFLLMETNESSFNQFTSQNSPISMHFTFSLTLCIQSCHVLCVCVCGQVLPSLTIRIESIMSACLMFLFRNQDLWQHIYNVFVAYRLQDTWHHWETFW